MSKRFAIIGLGLIGGSVARAIKARLNDVTISAYDVDSDALVFAKQHGVIDEIAQSISDAVSGAELVVLTMPVGAFVQTLQALQPVLTTEMVVTDVASVKVVIEQQLQQVFGEVPANVVLGHPLAGSDKKGVKSSQGELFVGSRVVLTPQDSTKDDALEVVTQFWQQLGASVTLMPAQEHDHILAVTSHLPHLLAYAYMKHFVKNHDAQQHLNYTAGGFRDFTRIARSSPSLWRDICLTNRESLLNEITQFKSSLGAIEKALQSKDADALLQSLHWDDHQ